MKKLCKSLVLAFFTAYLITSFGCKKDAENPLVTAPIITTAAISTVTKTSAESGGNVTATGGAEVLSRGVCWSTSQNPTTSNSKTTDGSGSGVFSSNLTGLAANTTYYVRAYATNSAGTDYGTQLSFTTEKEVSPSIFNKDLTYGTISDIQGNSYKTVQIGAQTWMAENLKATKLNDGDSIPLITDNAKWNTTPSPGYCWYNNDPSHMETYGALYNWAAVNTGKLCPAGWHIPNSEEVNALNDNLGYGSTSGSQMKESGTSHWASPNEGATNESGWTALPGGIRSVDGHFESLGYIGTWWYHLGSLPGESGEFVVIRWDSPAMLMTSGYESTSNGISVRCIKDN